MEAFRSFKRLWDPTNRMNPGKLIDANEPHADLRLGADYKPWQPETHFSFASDGGSFEHAASRCVGVGACRKTDTGTMCPSYMATGEERESTRGRARLLWELMQGEVLPANWKSHEVKESLELCLACKACKSECPVGVDMATYKAEFLAHFYEGRLPPLRNLAFGYMDKFARIGSYTPRLANGAAVIGAPLVKAVLGIAPQRTLPRLSTVKLKRPVRRPALPKVLLWADTWNHYFHAQTWNAAAEVLSTAGFDVFAPKQHLCCGRPLYDFGLLDSARRYLTRILDALAQEIAEGTPVVVLEPSCASVFRDELTNLFPNDERARALSRQTLLLSEFLAQRAAHFKPAERTGRVIVQAHCHHKSQSGMRDEMSVLSATGAEAQLLDSGCCGMAGPFGFEKEKFEVSQAIGERVLLPAVRAAAQTTVVVADGFSCREQITQNTGRQALHLAEYLAGVAPAGLQKTL